VCLFFSSVTVCSLSVNSEYVRVELQNQVVSFHHFNVIPIRCTKYALLAIALRVEIALKCEF